MLDNPSSKLDNKTVRLNNTLLSYKDENAVISPVLLSFGTSFGKSQGADPRRLEAVIAGFLEVVQRLGTWRFRGLKAVLEKRDSRDFGRQSREGS